MLVAMSNVVKVESVPLNSSRSSPPPSGDCAFSYATRRRGVARFTVGGKPDSHAESPPAV
jgi:hypothetical protein